MGLCGRDELLSLIFNSEELFMAGLRCCLMLYKEDGGALPAIRLRFWLSLARIGADKHTLLVDDTVGGATWHSPQ